MIETRHNEKNMLFMLLEAQMNDKALTESKAMKKIVMQLEAQMEPEDVQLVHKKIADLRTSIQ
ncbi:MAG: hypothetical protein FWD96_05090 [Defluviitaleaceae bacterium]|nr:hypothetical protein [Defluviitaleaceae bacterium]